MREDKASDKIGKACKEIDEDLNGRSNPLESEIITAGCKKHKVNEKYIRMLLNIDAGKRSSKVLKQ